MSTNRIAAAVVLSFVLGVAAQAGVPPTVSYQGQLKDAAGQPVTGSRQMVFRFYDAATGGAAIGGFAETQLVGVTDGVFNVMIGSATPGGVPQAVFDAADVYLGVTVDGTELAPRQPISSVPFAFKAAQADTATTAETASAATTAQSIATAETLAPIPSTRTMPAVISVLQAANQGLIQGSYDSALGNGLILVYQLDHNIDIPLDTHTGLPTGQRLHSPMKIVKQVDAASPKLAAAICTGEQFPKIEIKLIRQSSTGADEAYYTITLENAICVSMRTYIPNVLEGQNGNFGHMEELEFTYSKITWHDLETGTETSDAWLEPR